MIKFILIPLLSIVVLFSSCSSLGKSKQNYAHLYKSTGQLVNPDYIIYHHEEDSSRLYFQIESSKVLYTRKNKGDVFSGRVLLHYEILENISSKVILDSGSFLIHDKVKAVSSKLIQGNFSFNAKIGDKKIMKVFCADQNRNSMVEKHIVLDKENISSKQFFLIRNAANVPVFTNYLNTRKGITVESSLNKSKPFYLRHYLRVFPISPPPFTSSSSRAFNYLPEHTSKHLLNDSGFNALNIPDSGFVHLQVDTNLKAGVTLFSYATHFPEIKSVHQMIPPTRYISSRTEYNKLLHSELIKSAVDYFWRDKTGSKDRAREVIKKYYNRVSNANEHFTSYIEGWKTDRGMISIVYGPPSIVSKLSDKEIWIYGDENNINSLSFVFIKMNNPFTNNDFKLQRSPMYKSSWYKAVDSWRNGRAYWIQ